MNHITNKKILIMVSILIFIFVLLKMFQTLYYNYHVTIPCIFNKITGLFCPGCGVTRMILSITKLDLYQAFRYNPLIFCMLPFIIFYGIDTSIKWIKGTKNYLYLKINNKAWIIILIITLLFGILRNIPLFKFLIPTVI